MNECVRGGGEEEEIVLLGCVYIKTKRSKKSILQGQKSLSFPGSHGLPFVLEPDLYRPWTHSQLSTKFCPHLSRREKGAIKDLVEDLELLCIRPSSFGLEPGRGGGGGGFAVDRELIVIKVVFIVSIYCFFFFATYG